MSDFGHELLLASLEFIDEPFMNHYVPKDTCHGGLITNDGCMERGMDGLQGYDCSGLIVASICTILGIEPSEWGKKYRHVLQLGKLANPQTPALIGDLLIYHQKSEEGHTLYPHIRIKSGDRTIIHASGYTRKVEEGTMNSIVTRMDVVPADRLLEILV